MEAALVKMMNVFTSRIAIDDTEYISEGDLCIFIQVYTSEYEISGTWFSNGEIKKSIYKKNKKFTSKEIKFLNSQHYHRSNNTATLSE